MNRLHVNTSTAHRRSAGVGLGLAAALMLSACGAETGQEASPTTTPVSDEVEETSPMAVESPTASIPSTPPDDQPDDTEGPDGDTQTYTTESGVFTWTLPASWTVEPNDEYYSDDLVDRTGGIPTEYVTFSNADGTAEFTAYTGLGPTDNDGPKPEVIDVVEAEELPDLPVSDGHDGSGSGAAWYRASILRAVELPGDLADEDTPEPGEYIVDVTVANVPEGVDPEDPADDGYWSAWAYYLDPPEDTGVPADQLWGTAAILSGGISQEDAEAITGLEGEEAVRAVVDSEEYAELRDVATSMDVDAP